MADKPQSKRSPRQAGDAKPSSTAPASTPEASARSRMRRELIEERVFVAAARLFAQKGYAGTTLQDIASAIGVSRTAMYYYVSSKEQVLAGIVNNLTDTWRDAVAAEMSAEVSAEERIRRVVAAMTRLVAGNPAGFRLLLQSEAFMPADIAKVNRANRRALLNQVIAVIEEGQRVGAVRPMDARSAAFALFGMWNWTAFWVRPSDNIDALAQTFGDIATYGLISQPGVGAERGPLDLLAAAQQDLSMLALMLDR